MMHWTEKVKRLQNGRTLASIEEAAGWSRNQLGAAMSRKSMPGADIAIALARALEVPTDWLFDERLAWPPPAAGKVQLDFDLPEVQKLLIKALGVALQKAGERMDSGR